jgi:hypothetical protein
MAAKTKVDPGNYYACSPISVNPAPVDHLTDDIGISLKDFWEPNQPDIYEPNHWASKEVIAINNRILRRPREDPPWGKRGDMGDCFPLDDRCGKDSGTMVCVVPEGLRRADGTYMYRAKN